MTQKCYLILLVVILPFLCACSKESAPPFQQSVQWLNRSVDFPVPTFSEHLTLLEFITDHCQGCEEILPTLSVIEKKYGQKINLLGIYTPSQLQPDLKQIQQLINKAGIHHPVIYDKDSNLYNVYNINVWPTIILVNQQQQIVQRWYGNVNVSELDSTIQQMQGAKP